MGNSLDNAVAAAHLYRLAALVLKHAMTPAFLYKSLTGVRAETPVEPSYEVFNQYCGSPEKRGLVAGKIGRAAAEPS
jgi:hypothetical protein